MLVESAVDAAAAGNWEKALDRLEEALAANQLLRDRSTQPFHMAVLADLHRSRGAYEQSLTAAHEAAWLARGTAFQEAWAGLSLGRTLLDLNAPGEAAKHLHDGLSAARRGTHPHLELRCAANLARLYCASGDTTEALNHVRQAEDLLGRISAPPTTAFLLGTDAYVAVASVRVEMSEPARAAALLAPVRAAAEASGWLEQSPSARCGSVAAATPRAQQPRLDVCWTARSKLRGTEGCLGRSGKPTRRSPTSLWRRKPNNTRPRPTPSSRSLLTASRTDAYAPASPKAPTLS